jgi:hypothetical protein
MKIGEEQNFAEMVGHGHDDCLDPVAGFLLLDGLIWHSNRRLHEVDEAPAILVGRACDRGFERAGGSTGPLPHHIACLVCSDREQPWPQAAVKVELLNRLVDLEEGLLEDIFGRASVTEEPRKEVKQLAFVSSHKFGERRAIVVSIPVKELFVGRITWIPLRNSLAPVPVRRWSMIGVEFFRRRRRTLFLRIAFG